MRVKQQEHNTQLLRVRQCELEARRVSPRPVSGLQALIASVPSVPPVVSPVPHPPSTGEFDISRQIRLVPAFRETEIDSYFSAFEHIAVALHWPREIWSLLLQCRLTGKAQEVSAVLSIEESLDYDILKASVLRAYELVPEAYRQKFRGHLKAANQTFVEFAHEKGALFDKWCQSNKVNDFEQLRELVLLEDFKNTLPDKIVVHLNEQKVNMLAQAAVLADEFVLTHKTVFVSSVRRESSQYGAEKYSKTVKTIIPNQAESRECFYCHEVGHLIAGCPVLKKKNQFPKRQAPKSVGFVHVTGQSVSSGEPGIDPGYDPFVSSGVVFLNGQERDKVPGSGQSFVLGSVLPFTRDSYCGSDVLVQGIELGIVRVPLHYVNIRSDLVSGFVRIAVRSQLRIKGVDLILGNDLAGEKVLPFPEVVENPLSEPQNFVDSVSNLTSVFPACVITRAQSHKYSDVVELSDSFLVSPDSADVCHEFPGEVERRRSELLSTVPSAEIDLSLTIDRVTLASAQKHDDSLTRCRAAVVKKEDVFEKPIAYFWDDGLLMRKRTPVTSECEADAVYQIVVPTQFHSHVLMLAHDHSFSGHLGITKTYYRILRHFFWPGLRSDVVRYCRSCHTCQIVGKPNQSISPAPLCPIPVVGEPFERVILDCVGPLPRTKSGHKFILTMMCSNTRFPEAVPLRTIKTKGVLQALTKFFSTFGLPKVVQTDQGTNFMSRLFKQVLSQLNIKHEVSSAYIQNRRAS